jgi:hypothetical protein
MIDPFLISPETPSQNGPKIEISKKKGCLKKNDH